MLSLIRKISSSQPRTSSRKSNDNEVNADETNSEQEEVDGTSYDPDADPRDPGRYYTFPHFAEDKQDNSSPFNKEYQANGERTKQTPTTPQTTPISKPNTTPSSTEPVSPPIWPISPISKRPHSGKSSAASKPVMQRRATTNLTPLPHPVIRERPVRRASAQVQVQGVQNFSPSGRMQVSPASRPSRSGTGVDVQGPGQGKEVHSPTRESKQQRNGSARSQR